MDSRGDDEEQHQNPFLCISYNKCSSSASITKIQFRKEVSRARWDEDTGMAEILERKGGLWTGIGIIRNGGKLYCLIEEILFLVEKGALLLLDANDIVLSLKDIYKMVAGGKYGCSWESFLAYRHLKSLGYIVGRHGCPWTLKSEKSFTRSSSSPDMLDNSGRSDWESKEDMSIIQLLKDLHCDEIRAIFYVYLPDSNFKKSSPCNPSFLLCLPRTRPPTVTEVEQVERKCNGIPLKFCHVEDGRVSFFSFDKVDLLAL